MESNKKYNVVIIGSGLGGLVCAAILAKEGKRVCVLERNIQFGGTLQTYARNKKIFDSGVHYIGGLDKGQNLWKIFNYLGILDKLKLQRMDDDSFDKIIFHGDDVVYNYAQGYDNFINSLAKHFPDERPALEKYCNTIKTVCSKFPMYNIRSGNYFEKSEYLEIDTKAFIESITSNKKLQNVLAGNNPLYAGVADRTPLYVHALVLNSYIESSWRCINGSSQITKALVRVIRNHGGEFKNRHHIVKLVAPDKIVEYAETSTGEKIYGDIFISNAHPAKTLEMLESHLIRNAYRHRIKSLENSTSVFIINAVLKKDRMKYENSNFYVYEKSDAWSAMDYTEENWPTSYAMFYATSEHHEGYADAVNIMAYMRYDEVAKWQNTFNNVVDKHDRGEDYETFKKQKAEKLLDLVEQRFPGMKNAIDHYYTATPLTYRDYIGSDDGSLYGIMKDYRDPLKTFISPRTKISNLLLTGQNINLHGVLGVSVSAVVTCSELLGMNYLVEKINMQQPAP